MTYKEQLTDFRRALKAAFPDQKFSVTHWRDYVQVSWKGLPEIIDVMNFSRPYEGVGGITGVVIYHD